jgi:hypothetical protein
MGLGSARRTRLLLSHDNTLLWQLLMCRSSPRSSRQEGTVEQAQDLIPEASIRSPV